MNDNPGLILGDKLYNRLKWMTLIVLPALGTLYFTFSQIWGWPKGEEVVGSLVALATFLGIILGLSTKAYNQVDDSDGVLAVTGFNDDTGQPNLAMVINELPENILNKSSVKFRVDPNVAPGTPPNH